MKITIETPNPGEEDEIIVRCASLDEKLMHLIYALKSDTDNLNGYMEDRITKLSVKDIFYFESVDNRVFAYTARSFMRYIKSCMNLRRNLNTQIYCAFPNQLLSMYPK